jgi:hypothetical protein
MAHKAKEISRSQEDLLLRYILPITTSFLVFGFVQAWVKTFYFLDPFNPRIGWISKDGSWPLEFALGVHFFGDYLFMNQLSLSEDPWSGGNNYPSMAMFIFRLFAFFPYKLGLFLWLIFGLLCIISPIIHATKKLEISTRIQVVALLGILAAPTIGTLDRGNNIFLLVPLLYFGYIYLQKDKVVIASILLGSACAIKLYPILIVFFILLQRKWKCASYSGIVFVLSNILFAVPWGNPIGIFKKVVIGAEAYDGLDPNGQPMLFSFAGLMNNFLLALGLGGSELTSYLSSNPRIFGIALLMVMLIVSLGVGQLHSYLIALTTIQLIPTVSYTYTRLWTIVALSLIIHFSVESREMKKELGFNAQNYWWGAIIGTNMLLSIWYFKPMSLISGLSISILLVMLYKSVSFPKILIGFNNLFKDAKNILNVKSNSTKTK